MFKQAISKIFRSTNNFLVPVQKGLDIKGLRIPEPTRSMLFVTGEDPQKAESPFTIKFNVKINKKGSVDVDSSTSKGEISSEPSLVWTRLPVKPNNNLETKKMYYPSYIQLTPEQRYQYLKWLGNVSRDTNLSYVFLYFYGLERQLLFGNFDTAVGEVVKLMKHHNKKTFINYAIGSLIASAIFKKRPDIVKRAPILLKETTNESLVLRMLAKTSISKEDVLNVRARIGYPKKNVEKYDKCFKQELDKVISEFEATNGPFFSLFNKNDFSEKSGITFANHSFPSEIRTMKIPQILENKELSQHIRNFLKESYKRCKIASQ